MQPEIELLRDPAHFGERVNGASHNRASICNHAEWQMASVQIFVDFGGQIVDPDFKTFINSDRSDVVASNTQQRSRFGDGMVRLFRDIEPHLLWERSCTFAQKVLRRLCPASRH